MRLDDETLALLGYARAESPLDEEEAGRVIGAGGFAIRNARDVTTSDIDGRHRARDRAALKAAYWARRRAKEETR